MGSILFMRPAADGTFFIADYRHAKDVYAQLLTSDLNASERDALEKMHAEACKEIDGPIQHQDS